MIEFAQGDYLVRHFPLHEARCRRAIIERSQPLWAWGGYRAEARKRSKPARAKTTKIGLVHESAVATPCAQTPSGDSQ